MKKFLFLLLLIGLGAGAWWYQQNRKPEAPAYQTAVLGKGDITQVVTATGTLRPVINVTVGCQISGTIQKLYADFNSQVKAGQTIAELDPATYKAIVRQAEGELASARATLELAELTAQRKEELVREKAAARADLDAALASLHQAQASVLIREGALQKARVDLERCTIASPIDGLVISRSVDVGQTVAASLSAPTLFTIANDMTRMQISAAVSEADIGGIAENQAVAFTVDAFPYTPFTGRVEQIRNAATTVQNVVTYEVLVAVDNPELKLKPGMTANVSITVAERKGVLRVPNAALRFRPPESSAKAQTDKPPRETPKARGLSGSNQRKVHVLAAGATNAEPVTVKLGITDNNFTEVLEGLRENDTVVTGMSISSKAPASPTPNPLGGAPMRIR